MNKRIKELAEQAMWHTNSKTGEGYKTHFQFEERFAELIVRECLEACSRANEIRHLVPPTQQQVVLSCMDEIERHFFGIEE